MCLTIISTDASELFGDKEKIICWKVMQFCGRSVFKDHQYNIGENISDRITPNPTQEELECTVIHKGIHVFTNKDIAIEESYPEEDELVVSVTCYKKDFIAIGENYDAVFNKVYLSRKQFAKFRSTKCS